MKDETREITEHDFLITYYYGYESLGITHLIIFLDTTQNILENKQFHPTLKL